MNKIIILLLIIISFSSSGQWSVSLGLNRRADNLFGENKLNYFDASISNRYLNDYFTFSVEHKKGVWVNNVELSFVYNNINVEGITSESSASQCCSSSEVDVLNADVSYSYLGLRVGKSRAFFKNNFYLILGPYLQTEFKLNEKESNHFTESTYRDTYWGGPVSEPPVQITETWTETSKEPFNAMREAGMFTSFGFELKPRYYFKHMFLEFNFSHGVFFYSRTYNLNPRNGTDQYESFRATPPVNDDKILSLFFETGLKVGYTFEQKVR